jgi:hypothetical protein
VDLPGGASLSYSIAVADMNNDGMLDIVIGNYNQKNQLLINSGDGTFSEDVEDLPGGALSTWSIAVADMNNDGMLDIVIGNSDQKNQLVPYSSCPNGGARLHSRSWCFRCPSFMGKETSICRECIPDTQQKSRSKEEQCAIGIEDGACPLGEQRKLGEDTCSKCRDGTYFNSTMLRYVSDPSTWDSDRCRECPIGQYATQNNVTVDVCLKCQPGTYQPEKGASSCLDCKIGTFQAQLGKDVCNSCSIGGYCDDIRSSDGGFTSCPPGTFNDKIGQSDKAACQPCPVGTFRATYGGDSSAVCLECPPGKYGDESGK